MDTRAHSQGHRGGRRNRGVHRRGGDLLVAREQGVDELGSGLVRELLTAHTGISKEVPR